jgi:nucleoside-diphosphate kinase
MSNRLSKIKYTPCKFTLDVVSRFRDLTGPLSPELARVLRPGSIRALYGHDHVHNAVHCTDLSEDGGMECHYIFQTLAGLLSK